MEKTVIPTKEADNEEYDDDYCSIHMHIIPTNLANEGTIDVNKVDMERIREQIGKRGMVESRIGPEESWDENEE